jgi:hypothetical protein
MICFFQGMQVLVRSLETKLVLNAFAKMQKAVWNSNESVVAESESGKKKSVCFFFFCFLKNLF